MNAIADEAISKADSSRMGKAVEHLVAATCILQSRALLNVSTSLVDDEGIDLVFHRKDATATLAVQVKARMSDTKLLQRLDRFQAFVRLQTLRPRPGLYLMFVLADVERGDVRLCWLMPSEEFVRRARPDRHERLMFVASGRAAVGSELAGNVPIGAISVGLRPIERVRACTCQTALSDYPTESTLARVAGGRELGVPPARRSNGR